MKILQHNEIVNPSRPVTDIAEQVIPYVPKMMELCHRPLGVHKGALALAHCQVERDNPRTFFVTRGGDVVINPEIIKRSQPFTHQEGCMSYAFRPQRKVKRYNSIVVRFQTVDGDSVERELTGLEACIMQHEMDHFRNVYVY